jgi:1-deoxy-D-xylulose-5-phosphate reductoisomerase
MPRCCRSTVNTTRSSSRCRPLFSIRQRPKSGPAWRAPGLLTASGGPFRTRELDTLKDITPEQAVAHPNWVMGKKISVDSATMMNKGLEVIEAHWLFNAPPEQIEVVIHPQSIVHSMVEYFDGSVLAQLSNPDMRTPIAHSLIYPERIEAGVNWLDLAKIGTLTFEAPDLRRFPCLGLAYQALAAGGAAPAMLNAANEEVVAAFLDKQIPYLAIAATLDACCSAWPSNPPSRWKICWRPMPPPASRRGN